MKRAGRQGQPLREVDRLERELMNDLYRDAAPQRAIDKNLNRLDADLMSDIHREAYPGRPDMAKLDRMEADLEEQIRSLAGPKSKMVVAESPVRRSLAAAGLGSAAGSASAADTGSIEAPRVKSLVKLANFLDSIDTDADFAGGISNYLRKMGYGDDQGIMDYLGVVGDVL